ncbi:MAG TPA: hypothetical protein PKA95_17965 [Thermomicrobiales bacterium]|nr:hypothetical protein [Thermomicrobiales bacterium]
MTDFELLGQMREITGEPLRTCDLCGRQIQAEFPTDARRYVEPDGALRICMDCRDLHARGNEPLAELFDDEIDG